MTNILTTTKCFLLAGLTAMLLSVGNATAQNASQPKGDEWHDMEVNQVNRLPMHTDFFGYECCNKALAGDKTHSQRFLSLHGDWPSTGWLMQMNVPTISGSHNSTIMSGL